MERHGGRVEKQKQTNKKKGKKEERGEEKGESEQAFLPHVHLARTHAHIYTLIYTQTLGVVLSTLTKKDD